MKKYRQVIWIFAFFWLISCSTNNTGKLVNETKTIADSEQENSIQSPYILGAGDEIIINVWRNDDLNSTVQIDPSGYIYLPLAGEIMASGLTIPQLKEKITLKLSKYILKPQVNISISSVKSKNFHVLGEVNSPGTFKLDRKMMVLDGISRAGGFNHDANHKKVLLVRAEKGVAKVTLLNLNIRKMDKNGRLPQLPYLRSGDLLYVPPSLIADIERFMKRVNQIILPFVNVARGFVLWDEAISILQGQEKRSSGARIPP